MSRRRAGLDAPASTTTRTGRSARAGRVVTGMVAGRGGAVGATIATLGTMWYASVFNRALCHRKMEAGILPGTTIHTLGLAGRMNK